MIGVLLGLVNGVLKAIEAGWPTNVQWCCDKMLEKWLEVDTFASWKKLFSVIKIIESFDLNKGDLCNYIAS